jgi:DNA-binding XRE family transcriptional regulator
MRAAPLDHDLPARGNRSDIGSVNLRLRLRDKDYTRSGDKGAWTRSGTPVRSARAKLRKALGLSQEALALNCSLDRSHVGAIERGESNVSLINANRLAERLRVKTAELFVDRRAGRWIFRGNVGTSEECAEGSH